MFDESVSDSDSGYTCHDSLRRATKNYRYIPIWCRTKQGAKASTATVPVTDVFIEHVNEP
jgi:hypothetical protein